LSFCLQELTVVRGDKEVVQDLSLTIPSGEVTGVVGPNGSGKSSLLRVLYGFFPVHKGQVSLDQTPLESWSPGGLSGRLGVCPQEAEPTLDFRVDQVLALPFAGDQKKVDEAVRDFPFLRLLELRKKKLSQLSGGERQRVRLGMSLGRRSPWLILDEPANHLDLATAWSLMEYLAASRSGGVIMALHDLATAARYCDRLIVLKSGQLAAFGPPREVLTEELLAGVFSLRGRMEWTGERPRLLIEGVIES